MSHIGKGIILSLLVATATFIAPVGEATAQEVAPPGPGETLIYLYYKNSFGGNPKFWVALNDQTVARIRAGRHAALRAKAGMNTLNFAYQGRVWDAIHVDDRPGETVYLAWGLDSPGLAEIDAEKGRKLIRKSKPTKPIDAIRPNNEEIFALSNLRQLGYDLQRTAGGRLSPDVEHAVVTFFRRDDGPDDHSLPVWSEQQYLGSLANNEGVEVLVPAGDHFFFSSSTGSSLLRARVEAGKHYYAWLDYGRNLGRVRLTPVSTVESAQLEDWLADVAWLEIDPALITGTVLERQDVLSQRIRSLGERAQSGELDFQRLDSEHAF